MPALVASNVSTTGTLNDVTSSPTPPVSSTAMQLSLSNEDIGCVVLAYGGGSEAERLVAQLRGQGLPPDGIVVVENPSPSARPIQLPFRDVEVLRMARNLGYAGGMNAGLAHHLRRGVRKVLLLTQDVELRHGSLAALVAAGRRSSEHGALGPVLLERGTNRPFSYGVRERLGGLDHIREPPPAQAGISDCEALDGAVMLLDAAALQAVGRLDDRFFMYFEESELCLRLRRHGWRVGVAVDAIAEQQSGASRRPAAFGYLMSRNGLEYARSASGASGLVGALYRQLYDTAMTLLPIRTAADQQLTSQQHRLRLVGSWLGVLAFLLRRWGPPPGLLLGLGDIEGTGKG